MGGLAGLTLFAPLCARADEKGETILREAFRTLHAAQSMTAELTTERVMTGQPDISGKGTLALKKPNLLNVTLLFQTGSRTQKQTFVSDGKNYFTYAGGDKTYMRQPAPKSPTEFVGFWEGEVDSFFGGEANAEKVNAVFAGTETIAGIPCDLVRVTMKQAGDPRVLTYAIGQKDRLIYRSSWTGKANEKVSITQTNRLRNIKLNGPVSASLFAFVPPRDAKLYDPEAALREMEAKLVAVGTEAPAFELTDPQTRSRFSLAKMLDGRKAVLVNFWFYG
jgi:outer membrane lipoprotein-sorting protein